LQVGGVTPKLTREVLSILEADDSTARRFKSIRFFDGDQELINKLATQYEGLKPKVQFVHTESEKSNLPLELKDSSIDLVLLGSQGLAEQQWSELLLNVVRILKPGGKLLTVSPVEHTGAQ
jgi:ubiquinone/menaquinone biosynthesis C-methylase UbiE